MPAAARYLKGDVARRDDLEPAFSGGLDAVCHVAGQVSLIRSFSDPVIDLQTNVQGTVNVLQLCLKYRVPRLLYASSMTVYGNTDVLPTPEETPCGPVSYYGITKYAAERYVHVTAERVDLDSDLHVTSFRMYNVYGPRQALDNPYQGVLGIFLGNLLRGEPLTIFGDGEQSRDFVYIGDVVDAWAARCATRPAMEGYSTWAAGPALHQPVGRPGPGRFRPHAQRPSGDVCAGRPGEQRHVEADTTRSRTVLGWEPRVPFAVGLDETVRWAAGAGVGARHEGS